MNISTTNMDKKDTDISASTFNFNGSPKKCNLSFAFNFDVDCIKSEHSSDSETPDLQIDVSEVNNYESPIRYKRETIEEISILNEMEEEIERQLDAKAAKTNLTATNVKNILKHVITNEHVMAMVRKRLHDVEDDITFEPKLTRAKAKELATAQINIPWHITPVKKPSSQVLIEEEFPDDSSDEEYNPEQDKQSDDDREVENSNNCDVDSQTSRSINHVELSLDEKSKSTDIQYDPERIFKIPSVPHMQTKEENIGQRTRSKLCLSETPLEQIEQAFVPPDITTDMYDFDCEVDEDWGNFLKEFTQPLNQEYIVEDDPEADPEYNILEDEETDLLDKEELRADKGVKITRKELNDLIAELLEFTDIFSKQEEQEVSKKKKSSDNLNSPIENNNVNCSVVDLLPALAEQVPPKLVSVEQRYLLSTQFRQHIQFIAQHFVMTYMHPILHSQSKTCKDNLNSLRYLSSGSNSIFNAENLPDALKLIANWENKFLDSKFSEDFKKAMNNEEILRKKYLINRWRYIPKFHPEMEKLLVESKALMYPQLLPVMPFTSEMNRYIKSSYLKSEENLIALGLEQFYPFIASIEGKFRGKKTQLMDTCRLIAQYLLPVREPQFIFHHIYKRRTAKDCNPIKHYFKKGTAPTIIHCITLQCNLKAPVEQPIHLLPLRWQTYLTSTHQKTDSLKQKHAWISYNDISKRGNGINEKYNIYPIISNNHPIRNPIINMLPKILPATDKNALNSMKVGAMHTKRNTNTCVPVSQNICETDDSKEVFNKDLQNRTDSSEINVKSEQNTSCDSINSVNISKVSRKAPEILLQSQQIRKTTPRLAKTKSAQNMKLMVQGMGPKGLTNCNTIRSRGKSDLEKTSDNVTPSKVDNEEEIAELMLASTTIKKDSLSRKKAKQARELENIKRLLEAENSLNEGEREAKFAASYLQKLYLILEPHDPDILKAIIQLFLDYNDKLNNMDKLKHESSCSTESENSQICKITEKHMITKDTLAIHLYHKVCEKLQSYPELCSDFLLFLKPDQAIHIGRYVEYIMLQKMKEFLNVAQVYFAKQPSRLAKMMQAITQLASDPCVTLENINAIMTPVLKGHPLVMDLFLQILPIGKPPESLFAADMFENLTCPLGPYDKNKVYEIDALELYENIDLPISASQEDPYGGDNCKCNCHNVDGSNSKSEHCMSCGTRFLNGRIYFQTSEGLRPAKITFPGADEEKLENIARVSLKTTDKFVQHLPSKQRRKSSKTDINDETCPKQCLLKNSPVKESDDNDKTILKPKRKSKSKDQKKPLKEVLPTSHIISNKKMRSPQNRSKREKKDEKRTKLESSCKYDTNYLMANELLCTNLGDSSRYITEENISDTIKSSTSPVCMNRTIESTSKITIEKMEEDIKPNANQKNEILENSTSSDNFNSDTFVESVNINNKAWTRQEDMILLQNIKKEYSENSFLTISQKLGDRTVSQVKERCQVLLSLLQKMS